MSGRDVDELVGILDERTKLEGERWDLYRLMSGGWGVKLEGFRGENDPLRRTVTSGSLPEVLRLAIASKRIPTVPRRPTEVTEFEFRPVKSGRTWDAERRAGGGELRFGCPTKTECVEAIKRYVVRLAEAAVEWDQRYGQLVADGVEGTDYVMEGSA